MAPHRAEGTRRQRCVVLRSLDIIVAATFCMGSANHFYGWYNLIRSLWKTSKNLPQAVVKETPRTGPEYLRIQQQLYPNNMYGEENLLKQHTAIELWHRKSSIRSSQAARGAHRFRLNLCQHQVERSEDLVHSARYEQHAVLCAREELLCPA